MSNQVTENFWITESDEGQFLVMRTIETHSGIITTYLLEKYNCLDSAVALMEDGVAGNCVGSGNVMGFPALMGWGWSKKKKQGSLLKRWLRGIDDDVDR